MAVEVHGTSIRIPQGDTGLVKFVCEGETVSDGMVGIFTVARRDGEAILRKLLPAVTETNSFDMAFAYGDTDKMRPDSYEWSFRVAGEGVFDTSGRLTGAKSLNTQVVKGVLHIVRVAGGSR